MLNVGLSTHLYDALTYSTRHPLCITISPCQMLGIFVKQTLAALQCPWVLRHYRIGLDIIWQLRLAHAAMWNVIALLSQVFCCHIQVKMELSFSIDWYVLLTDFICSSLIEKSSKSEISINLVKKKKISVYMLMLTFDAIS